MHRQKVWSDPDRKRLTGLYYWSPENGLTLKTRHIKSKRRCVLMKKLLAAVGKSIAETCVDIAYTNGWV